jgi:hypothetical protein
MIISVNEEGRFAGFPDPRYYLLIPALAGMAAKEKEYRKRAPAKKKAGFRPPFNRNIK